MFGLIVYHYSILLQFDTTIHQNNNGDHHGWVPQQQSLLKKQDFAASGATTKTIHKERTATTTAAAETTLSSSSSKSSSKNSNNLTSLLPQWLIEYAEWHDQVRHHKEDDVEYWSKQKILVVLAKDELAEGLSDRLRSLPFLLWEAHQTKRLLLIQWLRPYPLEEFLLPPPGGVDWRVPSALNLQEEPSTTDVVWHEYEDNFASIADTPSYQPYRVVKVQPNRFGFFEGMDYVYQTLHPAATAAEEQLSRIYHLLLTPSPPVQRLLDDTMKQLNLVPKQYIGVHLRARYPDYVVQFQFIPKVGTKNHNNETEQQQPLQPLKDELGHRFILLDPKGLAVDKHGILETQRAISQLRHLTQIALRCARLNLPYTVHPNPTPIYFASDTNLAIKLAMNETERIVGSVTDNERLHMNLANEHHQYQPSDFYPAIVDLWILSQAKCLAVGQGGYTLFAAVLGGAGNCMVFHSMQNVYASRYLPKGFVTIRNITFCKPQKDKMVRKLNNLLEVKRWEQKHQTRPPKGKRRRKPITSIPLTTWNVGN